MLGEFEAGAAEQKSRVCSLSSGPHDEQVRTYRGFGHSQHHRTRVAVGDFQACACVLEPAFVTEREEGLFELHRDVFRVKASE